MDCYCLHSGVAKLSGPANCRRQHLLSQSPARTPEPTRKLHSKRTHASKRKASHQVVSAAPQRSDISTRRTQHKPTSAETAKTVVDIVAHGTLCTVGEDGVPMGTYSNYILDDRGLPVLRLRADAVHTQNLRRSPKCSLFVQPGTCSANADVLLSWQ